MFLILKNVLSQPTGRYHNPLAPMLQLIQIEESKLSFLISFNTILQRIILSHRHHYHAFFQLH